MTKNHHANWIRLRAKESSEVKWDFWSRAASAPVWKWVALALRVNPDAVFFDGYESAQFYGAGPHFERFIDAVRLATLALRAGRMQVVHSDTESPCWSEVASLSFWVWWLGEGWELPTEMKDGVQRQARALAKAMGLQDKLQAPRAEPETRAALASGGKALSENSPEDLVVGLKEIGVALGVARGTPATPVPEATVRRWLRKHYGGKERKTANGKWMVPRADIPLIAQANP